MATSFQKGNFSVSNVGHLLFTGREIDVSDHASMVVADCEDGPESEGHVLTRLGAITRRPKSSDCLLLKVKKPALNIVLGGSRRFKLAVGGRRA